MRIFSRLLLLIFCYSSSFALGGSYDYIIITGGNPNNASKYYDGVVSNARERLTKKGFIVLNNLENPPLNVQTNACSLLKCSISLSKGYKSTVNVSITNCEGTEVFHDAGATTGGSALEKVFDKSLKSALRGLNREELNKKDPVSAKPLFPEVDLTTQTEKSIKEYLLANNDLNPLEGIYNSSQTESNSFYRIGIIKQEEKYIAIIIESSLKQWKQGEIKAVFEKSSINNMYAVKWFQDNKTKVETFITLENNGLIKIKYKGENSAEKEFSFIKMLP